MKKKLIYILILSINITNYLNTNLSLYNWKKEIKDEIHPNINNLIDKKLKKIKIDLENLKISPTKRIINKKFKTGYTINNYQFINQNKFLKAKFKNHSWLWWWNNNKLAFIILFPLYFANKYNCYPPIYYDFFSAYGYYPENEYFDLYLDKCIKSYKNYTSSKKNKYKTKLSSQDLNIIINFCVDLLYKNILS